MGDIKETPEQIIRREQTVGRTSAVEATKEGEKIKVTEVMVQVDPILANEASNTKGVQKKDAGSAITLGHEFGHAKAMLDNPEKYKAEVKAGTAEAVQAEPIENAVREELRKQEEEQRKNR